MALSKYSRTRTAFAAAEGDASAISPALGQPGRQWLWTVATALIAVTLILSINAVKLGIGPVPLRFLTLLGCGACIAVADVDALRAAFRDTSRALLIVVLSALLGVVVSILAKTPPAEMVQQLIEIHVQAVLSLVFGYALVLRYGPRPLLIAYLIAYGICGVFALGQAAGIDAAWQARALIGRITNDPPITQLAYITRYRAMGLAFTPVLFGTQTCLALASVIYLRFADPRRPARRWDWVVLGSCLVFGLLSMATGNRSPLLAMAVFLPIYALVQAPKFAIALLPLALVGVAVAQPLLSHLDDAGVRVARTDDSSSEGRTTLRHYGLFLVKERPIGYGLDFDSTRYWASFAHQARYMENPLGFRQWAIHNYYVATLAKYGVLIALLLIIALPRTRRAAFLWLPFLPYIVHIYFHNDGPLQGDFLFFFIIAAGIWLYSHPERWQGPETKRTQRPRPWRRAFATGVLRES